MQMYGFFLEYGLLILLMADNTYIYAGYVID